ncbi:AsmA family protein [Vibrio metschnikovii]|uniref:AsmA family protein n=1 Tax=Vibrio metschnikovii TaxID=28172 RepID=UPI0029849EA5|nr:AsmA family protein [Vibrio metschnikovii]EKO3595538.1 AsmA family protein [Vibrio metschnikovii]EKO3620245.1 AsmA family protein [Vibrio metschnikovii]EKO3623460.1 AsmA family protein [Vibrio metschnikovii]EKO3703454.1 AsmA family protein [Vibrio metschnikovii]
MKKLSLFIAALLVMVIAAVVALVVFVNPNQFKPLIIEQTKQQTGLELVIEGDISWQFFPAIGFELGKTELRNPDGFTQNNLFKVDRVGIDIAVMPLFRHQLHIGNVRLEGAEFYLETLLDGRSNLESLTQAQNQKSSAQVEEALTESPSSQPETTADQPWTLSLAGVTVSQARLEILDQQTGTHSTLYDVDLTVSEFAADRWTSVDFSAKGSANQQQFSVDGKAEIKLSADFKQYALRNITLNSTLEDPSVQIDALQLKLATFEFDQDNALTFAVKGNAADMAFDVSGQAQLQVDAAISTVSLDKLLLNSTLQGAALPQSPMQVEMASRIVFDVTNSTLDVVLDRLMANAIALSGKANIHLADIPKIRFQLHSPAIDLDEFFGLDQATPDSAAQPAVNAPTSLPVEVEPDLSALQNLDVAGEITIDQFKAGNAKLHHVHTRFAVNRGVIDLNTLTAELYQGKIQASAKVDARKTPATYQVKKTITGVQVQPLLIDVADNDLLQGTGNITVDVQGRSLTPSGIQKNLLGTVTINFADGAVNGINVAQLIRTNHARLRGQTLDESEAVKQTDFSALTATLQLNKGEVSTNNLAMQSPLLRIRGEGKANYLNETVDFVVRTSIVGTLKGQGGKDIDELRDVTIPIHISGQWTEPRYRLVFDDLLKQRAQKEIDRGIEKLGDKVKGEEAKQAVDALRGLLRR